MSEPAILTSQAALMGPLQRMVDLFAAPSKTFADVKRRPGWWVPWVIAAMVGLLYAYALVHKVGLPALVDGVIHQSSSLEDRMASSTPEQAAQIRSSIETQFKLLYAGPVFSLLLGLAAAGVLLATANFGAGGRATYGQMLGVWFYATLPLTLFYLLVVAALYGGVIGDSFNIKNPLGSNVGFYLTDSGVPKTLIPALSAIDLFAVWTAVLLTIGLSTVAGIKRGGAAAIVFGWWIVVILFQTAGAAFGG